MRLCYNWPTELCVHVVIGPPSSLLSSLAHLVAPESLVVPVAYLVARDSLVSPLASLVAADCPTRGVPN
jgi:hypothetical protein